MKLIKLFCLILVLMFIAAGCEKKSTKLPEPTPPPKPAGQPLKNADMVKLAVGKIFVDGQLPTCVKETVNITKDEFEQKLAKLYEIAPSVKELIDNLDNLADYIRTKSGYEEVAPLLSYSEIPFSVSDEEYVLVLSPRDALSLLRGFVSADSTCLVSHFKRYAPDHLLAPGFLNFRVIRNSDNCWIGNVYTVVANTKKGTVLIIDALQLPWQGGISWLYIKTFPVESLRDSKQISQAAIIALVRDYAAKVNLQEVWLAFTSNFYPLVDYYQDVIYADCPSKSLEQAKQYFSLIGIEDSTSVASFTWWMQTRGEGGPLKLVQKSPRRFIRIWPLEETEANRLHIAARMADIAKLKGLIEEGAKIDRKDESGNTALHYAAKSGFENVVKFLIARDANVNARDEEGKTPLHHAAEHAYERTARLLISEGADIDAKDAAGDTPLNCAMGSESVTKDIVKMLISEGADVNAKNAAGDTPVHFAARSRNVGKDIIELLISKGANINAKNKNGQMPVDIAARSRREKIVKLFIDEGADVTTIHLAAYTGNLNKVRSFQKEGFVVDSKDEDGSTPFDMAVSGGHADVVKFLIDKGAEVNPDSESGWTPLHSAADEKHEAVAKSLVAAGANVNAKDKSGYLPLHYALWNNDEQMVKLLVNSGTDIKAKDSNGYTALHWAIIMANSDLVKFFLSEGADVKAKNNDGQSALSLAKDDGQDEIVELLLQHGAKE